MTVETYAIRLQSDAFDPASDYILVSDRASVNGTGYRTAQEIFTAVLAAFAQPVQGTILRASSDGLVGTPSIYLNESNTGWWRPGAGILAFSVLGSELFRYEANKITLAEGTDVPVGTATGTKWGTATTQKQAFYGSTPIVQPTAPSAAGAAVATTASTQTTPYGYTTQAQADDIITELNLTTARLNSIYTKLQALGLIA